MLLDAADMKLLLRLLSWVYQHKAQELLTALALLLDPESNCTNDMRCAPSTDSLMTCLFRQAGAGWDAAGGLAFETTRLQLCW
jgi:hypothetical protein